MSEPNENEVENKLDIENAEYWDEPCGTNAFRDLGFESKLEFDNWYFDFYPYLEKHIPFSEMSGKKVFEVGLGYGTVSQKIMEANAIYYGMDIAKGPVDLVQNCLEDLGVEGYVKQGSILECPYEDNSFDYIISIGCIHHTGDIKKSIEELHRILIKDGIGVIMIYNAFSYRQWISAPLITLKQLINEIRGSENTRYAKEEERMKYDHNSNEVANPFTEFIGKKGLRKITKPLFSNTDIVIENIGDEGFLSKIPRNIKNKIFGHIVGLDLYINLRK